jgi:hypothetical protein
MDKINWQQSHGDAPGYDFESDYLRQRIGQEGMKQRGYERQLRRYEALLGKSIDRENKLKLRLSKREAK